jgi:hypothetical protein
MAGPAVLKATVNGTVALRRLRVPEILTPTFPEILAH